MCQVVGRSVGRGGIDSALVRVYLEPLKPLLAYRNRKKGEIRSSGSGADIPLRRKHVWHKSRFNKLNSHRYFPIRTVPWAP